MFYEEAVKNTGIFSTGCKSLDLLLDGGLWAGEMVEITGPPGCGKSQTCFTAAANIMAHSKGRVLYIDTNGSFVCERLLQIIVQGKEHVTNQFLQDALSNLQYLRVFDAISLLSQIRNLEYHLSCQTDAFYCKLKLLVLDSISHVISPILGGGQTQGHMLMMEIGRTLKKISSDYNIATIVVNNVVSSERNSAGNIEHKPALGKSWKIVPHSRIQFESLSTPADRGPQKYYRAVLTKSNKMETGQVARFTITERGIVDEWSQRFLNRDVCYDDLFATKSSGSLPGCLVSSFLVLFAQDTCVITDLPRIQNSKYAKSDKYLD
eukprot:gene13867-15315_t